MLNNRGGKVHLVLTKAPQNPSSTDNICVVTIYSLYHFVCSNRKSLLRLWSQGESLHLLAKRVKERVRRKVKKKRRKKKKKKKRRK